MEFYNSFVRGGSDIKILGRETFHSGKFLTAIYHSKFYYSSGEEFLGVSKVEVITEERIIAKFRSLYIYTYPMFITVIFSIFYKWIFLRSIKENRNFPR